jgi:hypothetical protein
MVLLILHHNNHIIIIIIHFIAAVNVVADDDCVIYSIEQDRVDKLFEQRPELGGKFYKFLGKQRRRVCMNCYCLFRLFRLCIHVLTATQIGKRLRKNEELLADEQASDKNIVDSHSNAAVAGDEPQARQLEIIKDIDIRNVYNIGRMLGRYYQQFDNVSLCLTLFLLILVAVSLLFMKLNIKRLAKSGR